MYVLALWQYLGTEDGALAFVQWNLLITSAVLMLFAVPLLIGAISETIRDWRYARTVAREQKR